MYPLLIWYTPRLQYEPLFTLLLALAILWTLRVQEEKSLWPAVVLGFGGLLGTGEPGDAVFAAPACLGYLCW